MDLIFVVISDSHTAYYGLIDKKVYTMKLYLVSSESEKFHENNTRSRFKNLIPDGRSEKYSAICLKDIYFKAEFCNINRQEAPHLVVITDTSLTNPLDDDVSVGVESSLTTPYKQYTESIASIEIDHMLFDIGKTRTYRVEDLVILEVCFDTTLIKNTDQMLSMLTSVIKCSGLSQYIRFSRSSVGELLQFANVNSCILFDKHFARFLGFTDLSGIRSNDVRWELGLLGIRHRLSTLTGDYCYLGRSPQSLTSKAGREETNTTIQTAFRPLIFEINKPQNVIVECDIVKPQIFNSEYKKFLAVIPISSERHDLKNYREYGGMFDYVHFQPIQPIFIPVSSDQHPEIEIRLVDEDFQQLKLTVGSPTLVALETSSTEMSRNTTIMFISSDDKRGLELHPWNTATRFSHELPCPILLESGTENTIDPISISIPSKIFNIRKKFNTVIVRHGVNEIAKLLHGLNGFLPAVSTEAVDSNVESLLPTCCSDFLRSNRAHLGDITHSFEIKPDYYDSLSEISEQNAKFFQYYGVKISDTSGHILLENISSATSCDITLTNTLASILGVSDPLNELSETTISIDPRYRGSFPYNLNLHYPNYIIVYADFVENSVIGGSECSILKILPAPKPGVQSRSTHFDFSSPGHTRIVKNTLSQLQFELRDIAGDLIETDSPSSTSLMIRVCY